MRILVLGAGGIGGYFGGRLAEAGKDVTFLVRDARAQRLRDDGLVIESQLGNARLMPAVATRATLEGGYDLVMLSCKAYDLDTAIEAIRPAVGPQTTILPLLNGLAHLDRLDTAFGAPHVIGGLAYISATLADDGTIRHLNKLDGLVYGAREPAQDDTCAAIEAAFTDAAFSPKHSTIVMQEMWEKFAFITAAAAITCLMRASIRTIMATTDGERLTRQIIAECQGVAAAAGFPVREKPQKFTTAFLTDRTSDFTASMLRDLEAGQQVEADQLPGDMIARGATHAVATDLLRVVFTHLQSYQAGAGRSCHLVIPGRARETGTHEHELAESDAEAGHPGFRTRMGPGSRVARPGMTGMDASSVDAQPRVASTFSRSAALMRPCQPGPAALK